MLLRALRDFNLGKLTSDDTSIFMGLLNDLFPKTLELVPRAVEKDFEAKVRCVAKAFNAPLGVVCVVSVQPLQVLLSQRNLQVSATEGCWQPKLTLQLLHRSRRLLWSWVTSLMRPSASRSASCGSSLWCVGQCSCWALLAVARQPSGTHS